LRKLTAAQRYEPTLTEDGERLLTAHRVESIVRLALHDARTGELLQESEPMPRVLTMALGPDERSVVIGLGQEMRIIDGETLAPISTITPVLAPQHVGAHPTLVIGGGLQVAQAWSWSGLEHRWRREDLDGHVLPCTERGAAAVVLHEANGALLVDAETGATLERFPPADQCRMAPSGRRMLTREGEQWRVWALRDSPARRLIGHRAGLDQAWLSPDERRLAVMLHERNGTRVLLHDLPSSEAPPRSLAVAAKTWARAAFSSDGRWLAAASDELVTLTDLESGEARSVRLRPEGAALFLLEDLVFSPDSRVLAWTNADHDQTIGFLDVVTGELLPQLVTGLDRPNQIAFSSDGKTLAIASPRGIEVWDLEKRSRKARLTSEMGPYVLTAIDVSPTTGWIAFAGRRGKTFLHPGEGESAPNVLHAEGLGDQGTVRFSPDGRWLCAGDDHRLAIWNVEKRREALRINDTTAVCSFTKDSSAVMTGLGKDGLFVVPLSFDRLRTAAKDLVVAAERSFPLDLPSP
jgi:hypothetical protein